MFYKEIAIILNELNENGKSRINTKDFHIQLTATTTWMYLEWEVECSYFENLLSKLSQSI